MALAGDVTRNASDAVNLMLGIDHIVVTDTLAYEKLQFVKKNVT